ncbi:protein of unknown function [Bradyrhizobium vignae]|uniref:Uncharacterized protein n=1 Tax=Bradyrhizobium vignae TaxID=1549949 RepID=A0A2U3QBC2_9BRAD|nr:protein of unknown function [Bradyrhizobium vignae]
MGLFFRFLIHGPQERPSALPETHPEGAPVPAQEQLC